MKTTLIAAAAVLLLASAPAFAGEEQYVNGPALNFC